MELFVEYIIRQQGSRMRHRRGEMLRPDTIRDYANAIRIFRSREARREVVSIEAGMLVPLA
eukprot:3801440-Pleurochrysis_carterae.AAC.1